MTTPRFNRPTLLWVALVLMAGLGATADMCRHAEDPALADAIQLAVFGGLGVFWTLLTFHSARARGGRAAISLAPAAYLSLLAIAEPVVVAIAALTVVFLDWAIHRRHALAGTFNVGQTMASLWAAHWICAVVAERMPGFLGAAAATLVGGFAYTLCNVVLLQVVLRLASGRSAEQSGIISFAALTNEIVVACFAAIMGLCWMVENGLLALPVIPQTLLFLTLSRLEQRENSLRARQSELQSLQELGLQVSAQLDRARLGPVVARIVSEDLRGGGALVAFSSDEHEWLTIEAWHDTRPSAPSLERLDPSNFPAEFFSNGQPFVAGPAEMDRYHGLRHLGARSFVAHPVSILGRPEALIIVYDGPLREPFTAEDASRLSSLVRFIEVAFNNARLYDDVKSMQQQLIQSEKLSALGQLISGVAHELNNPLATIMGSAELLGGSRVEPGQARTLHRIQREAARAARIVRNLLTFGRRNKPDFDWSSLNEVVQDVIEIREYECRSKDLHLEVELDPDLPLVHMDKHQIHQVLLNLVTNAMHALEDRRRGASITVRTAHVGGRVQLEVVDNGHGIEESRLDRIFNPFYTTKPVGKGTGLGLSICYGIVQEHGGTIRVKSVPGRGATFTVELPVHESAPDEPAEPEIDRIALPSLRGRVLVVDDEEGMRTVICEALRTWGLEPVPAASGEQGLEILRGGDLRLAILDLRMPGLDGPGLYDKACAEGLEIPPLLFSTGDAASDDARVFLERTGAPVLLKPFTLLSLREAIDELLTRRPEPASA